MHLKIINYKFPSCQRWKQVPFASAYFYDNWLASLVKFLKSKYSNDGRRYDRIICIVQFQFCFAQN
ncbi:hypothetical protein T05_13788 [Trichinella murrelli]|uniref:Uncharacterized protein n=1 Tax=Trichinella murrelli TaxID=144512 RepID=A0A0V0U0G6_9BILA|nr:hypothetical protein T05_13788 [Trichinella murrelli]